MRPRSGNRSQGSRASPTDLRSSHEQNHETPRGKTAAKAAIKRRGNKPSGVRHLAAGGWVQTAGSYLLSADGVIAAVLVAFTAYLFGSLHEKAHGFGVEPLVSDPLKQELALYSEQAFYYSYFLRAATAPSFGDMLSSLVHDETAEYGHAIIPLQRFNVYPEAVLAGFYRISHALLPAVWCPTPMTFMLRAVWTLSGIQVAAVYLLARRLSTMGTKPIDPKCLPLDLPSRMGGLVAAAAFLMNCRVTTRVFSHPVLRENFGLPFLWVQMIALVHILRLPASLQGPPPDPAASVLSWRLADQPTCWFSYIAASTAFLLSWQFGAFVLLLQAAAIVAGVVLQVVSLRAGKLALSGLIASALIAAFAMIGNAMLLSSLMVCFCVAAYTAMSSTWLRPAGARVVLFVLFVAGGTVGLKGLTAVVLGIQDDSHVFRILQAKLPPYTYKDFDTLQYLCGPAYNMLPGWVVSAIMQSGILPVSVVLTAFVALSVAADLCTGVWRAPSVSPAPRALPARTDPALFVFVVQTVPFSLLGVGIMRLMMFGTTSLCILTGIAGCWYSWFALASRTCPCFVSRGQTPGPATPKSIRGNVLRGLPLLLMMAVMSAGWPKLSEELAKVQSTEPPNPAFQQSLFELASWSRTHIKPGQVVSASPVVSSALLVSWSHRWPSRPAISVHPHAENPEIRLRYRAYYQIYSRLPEHLVYAATRLLHTDFLVIDFVPCDTNCLDGYSYADIALEGANATMAWALSYRESLPDSDHTKQSKKFSPRSWDKALARSRLPQVPGQEQFCYYATEQPLKYFQPVFQNDRYLVLQVVHPSPAQAKNTRKT